MGRLKLNSLVGITDYDEGTNLSCYLIQHGWNTEHVTSAEEILSDLEQGGYGLVVLDEEMLSESAWSLPDYLEEVGADTALLILTEPGSTLGQRLPRETCHLLQHPFTYESLRMAIEGIVSRDSGPHFYEDDNEDENESGDEDSQLIAEFDLGDLI